MRTGRVFYYLSAFSILFLCCSSVSGLVIKRSLEDRVALSDLIIVGQVQEIRSQWNAPKTHIWTYVTVSRDECIKGSNIPKNIVVMIPGGIVKEEGIMQEIEGTPGFSLHERVLLMLRFLPDLQLYALVNSEYSKFRITETNQVAEENISKDEFIQKIKRIMASSR